MIKQVIIDVSVGYNLLWIKRCQVYIVRNFICYFFRCIIIFSLIINDLHLKRQTAQKFTCFFAKNRRFNVFLSTLSEQREKSKKTPFLSPDRPRLQRQSMSGFISQKWAVKSRVDSRIFWGSNHGILCLVEEVFCSPLITSGAYINFAAK